MTHATPAANALESNATPHAPESATTTESALFCLTDAVCSLEHGAEALENLLHLLRIGQLMEADSQAEAALMAVAEHYAAPFIRMLRGDATRARAYLASMGVQV